MTPKQHQYKRLLESISFATAFSCALFFFLGIAMFIGVALYWLMQGF